MIKAIWNFITSWNETTILTIAIILWIIGLISIVLIGKAVIKHLENREDYGN